MRNSKSKILLVFLIIIVIVFIGRIVLEMKFCGTCDRKKLLCSEDINKEPFPKGHPINTNAVYCACCTCVYVFKS